MPTILLATANDPKNTLKVISEGKEIQSLLDRVHNKNYQIKFLPEISTSDLIDELKQIDDDLEIIHYCGHASPEVLQFTDKDVDSIALTARLKECVNLKFVFLNGCNTKKQVKLFHDAGIPYIIATSTSIEDGAAHWFATQFYKYLSLGNNIEEAFGKTNKDAAVVGHRFDLEIRRDISGYEEISEESEWGLYVLKDVNSYILPLKKSIIQISEKVEHGFFLKSLIMSLKNYNSPLDKSYLHTIDTIESTGDVSNDTIFSDLLKILPYPIGIRLRQIYASAAITEDNEDQYFRELLQDYACFFETLLHYSLSMLISSLWQHQDKIEKNLFAKEFNVIKEFVKSNRLRCNLIDYALVIDASVSIASKSGISHSISRITQALSYLDDNNFEQSCRFFDLQKDFSHSRVRQTKEEAVRNCYQSQVFLIEVFKHFGFIIENMMASIRSINVINFRYVEEAYSNEVLELVATNDNRAVARQKRFKRPMENKSVLCFGQQDFTTDTPSTNLFPFYLDRTAFTKQTSNALDLYQFMGYFQDEWTDKKSIKIKDHSCYYFISLINPERIWCFDEQNFTSSTLSHIDEEIDERNRHALMLSGAGELNNYFERFKNFLNL